MSPVRAGRGAGVQVSADALLGAAAKLDSALEAGNGQLPQRGVESGEAIVTKVRERLQLVGGHTVVALAGATGSGKSSLFNRLVGEDIATVGARRPTTSTASAAVWGAEPVGELLDWLEVTRRHSVPPRESGPDGSAAPRLDGLVLLDLPDFDSREAAHRAEAERVLALVDLFVWVTDPQKYADARLHDDYVSALAEHEAVTLVVLNQVDRLTPPETAQCVDDLRRLLVRDGLPQASILATSARTGQGIEELRQRLANTVVGQTAARTRLAGDLRTTAAALGRHVAASEPSVRAADERDLMDALARTAGVPIVVEAVQRDYRMESAARTGWPFTRWVHRVRSRPLRRLRLDTAEVSFSESEIRGVIGRSSIPPPTPAARAAVELATRGLAARAGEGLPQPWADAAADAASPPTPALADALDQAVLSTPLHGRHPLWWRAVGALQLVLALAALGGLLWYMAIWVMQWLQFPDLTPPLIRGVLPVPFVMVVGGVLLGILLAALSRFLAGIGARRRATAMDRRLRASIAEVADARIVAPVQGVLDRHRATREHLEAAQRL